MDVLSVKPGQVYRDTNPQAVRAFVVVTKISGDGKLVTVHRCKSDGTERVPSSSKVRIDRLRNDYVLMKDV